jgi:hypothetical protein
MGLGTKIIWTAIIFIIVGSIIGVSSADGSKDGNKLTHMGAAIAIASTCLLIIGILINIWF